MNTNDIFFRNHNVITGFSVMKKSLLTSIQRKLPFKPILEHRNKDSSRNYVFQREMEVKIYLAKEDILGTINRHLKNNQWRTIGIG